MNQYVAFTLRPWAIEDLSSLVKYANNWQVAKNMTDKFPHPYTETDGQSFVDFATADSPIHLFAIDIDGEAVGGIGVHPQTDIHRKNAELGYWLGEPFWGQGIVRAAIKRVVDFAFETYDVDRVFARPFGTNAASQKVLEANGFTLEARFDRTLYKNGEYVDELIYALRRQDWINQSSKASL